MATPKPLEYEDGKPVTAVFDIDGVLACNQHRIHHLRQENPDWSAYDAAIMNDVALPMCHVARLLVSMGVFVILLTNRHANFEDNTRAWLAREGIPFGDLIMRAGEQWHGLDYENFKPHVMRTHVMPNYAVKAVFEDHPKLVHQFEEAGYPVVYIHSGYYDGAPDGDWNNA